MTIKNDTATPAKVATSIKTVPTNRPHPGAPLVGKVTGGTGGAGTVTITDLVRQAAVAGVTFDLNDPGSYKADDLMDDLTEYLANGKLTDLYAPKELSGLLSPDGGGTPQGIVTGYFQWRAARRSFCQQLQQFIAAVEADDARRNREEFVAVNMEERLRQSALQPTKEQRKQRGQEVAADTFAHIAEAERIIQADYAEASVTSLWGADAIGDYFLQECDQAVTLQPCAQSAEGAAAFAAAIFGPDLVPDPKNAGGQEFDAFIIAAVYLQVAKSNHPAGSLLQAAAVIAQRMMAETEKTTETASSISES